MSPFDISVSGFEQKGFIRPKPHTSLNTGGEEEYERTPEGGKLHFMKAREALAESGLSCDLLFQGIPVGVGLATVEGLILETNDCFRQMLGHTGKDSIECRLNELYERQEDYTAFMDHLKGEGVVRGSVVRLKRKDGSVFDTKLNAAKLLLNGRELVFTVIEDLSKARDRESQLLHSQKMEAIGRLTGGVVHDFNNVITSIMGYTDLMLSNMESDDPLRSNLEKIKKAVERASAMTRRLLAFSRRQVPQPKLH